MLFPLTGQTSLYILLPLSHSLSDLQQLEEGLSDRSLAAMMEALRSSPQELIEVTIPKIRLDLQTDMGTVLRKLGGLLSPGVAFGCWFYFASCLFQPIMLQRCLGWSL